MEYMFKLTAQEIDFIAASLGKQPYEAVAALLAKLKAQYEEQIKPAPVAEPDDVT